MLQCFILGVCILNPLGILLPVMIFTKQSESCLSKFLQTLASLLQIKKITISGVPLLCFLHESITREYLIKFKKAISDKLARTC
jgi:hypothetical protein